MVMSGCGLLLEVLLNGRVILLRCRQVAGLQILRKLRKRSGNRAGIRLTAARLQRREIGLRLRDISGLQVLAELLEFLFEFLLRRLCGLRTQQLKDAATRDSCDSHAGFPLLGFCPGAFLARGALDSDLSSASSQKTLAP